MELQQFLEKFTPGIFKKYERQRGVQGENIDKYFSNALQNFADIICEKQREKCSNIPPMMWRICAVIPFQIIIKTMLNELNNYVWSDKKSETPINNFNHLLDAAGYALTGQPKITIQTKAV